MKSKAVILILTVLYVYILFNRLDNWKNTSFFWDKMGYYSYLPAVFIYKDLGGLSFYPAISEKYRFTGDEKWYTLHQQPTGRKLNKYAIGTALFELPFFLAAHFSTLNSQEYEADGFSHPYQLAVAFSAIFWVVFGLLILQRMLRNYFPDVVVAITILCLAIGTNLYHYTAFDHGMSHPYSFFLFCCILYLTDVWHKSYRPVHLYLLGVILGFIAITRPINIVIAIVPFLWQVGTINSFANRLLLLARKWKQLLIAVILFFAVAVIQLAYWKYITGHWIHYSYEGEGFNFLKPKIWKGLFSYQKGWFVYTPIAFLGIIGLFTLWKSQKIRITSLVLFFTAFIYIVFSWRNWWYGGSFGSRAMIEALAVLSIPFASLCHYIYGSRMLVSKIFFSAIIVFFITVNMYQSYQYSYGIIHWDKMSKEYYWQTFLKMRIKEEDRKLLLTDEDISKELE